METQNIKTILIDFDNWNSIKTIFNINKCLEKEDIVKISSNLNIFSDINFKINELNKYVEIQTKLDELKKEYDFLIIDISSNIEYEQTKLILEYSNKIIFLIEPNILEIKKASKLLEIYIKDWNIDINKIKIVFNKTNKNKIALEILKDVFSKIKIIGEMEYNEKINLFINKRGGESVNLLELEKIYKNLI